MSKHCWENVADRLRDATSLQFVKNTVSAKCNKAKCKKMKFAYVRVWANLISILYRVGWSDTAGC